jgi:subtilase family serine protease
LKALTAISIAIGVLASSLAQAQTQFHAEKSTPTTDMGLAPQNEVRGLTLSLNLKNQAALEAFAASTVDPTSSNYHQFLTPAQFGAKFGQDPATVAQVVNFLQAQGLTVSKVYSNNLFISVSGTNAQLAAVFGSPIHVYQQLGQTYEAPASATAIPTQLSGVVNGVLGLSTQPMVRSNAVQQPSGIPGEGTTQATKLPTPNASATGTPGSYTTADLANLYDINPLYSAGITGAGKTIGIMTLAGYNQSDAYAYWANINQPVNPSRITDVPVDGGAKPADGPGSEGAGETTLDVEQSGGVAPGANMRVYIAPNTSQGFIDAFLVPINENIVDTLSISWGSAEIAEPDGTLPALHTAFLQAASQGIPIIAAAGDAGAYDINRSYYTYPSCTSLLSVDYPAADPMVLAAGGTTVPHTQNHLYGTITIPQERAWAWDYLRDYIVKYYGQAFYYANYFPVGGGGGVSVNFARPTYQAGVAGVANSNPGQSLFCKGSLVGGTPTTYYDLIDMPANAAGRNLPDVSLNADPYSGYLVYENNAWSAAGGTSFVAPQLNGIFTLIASAKGGRLGQLQPQLYNAFKTYGYGAGSPFRPISAGTDFFYSSKATFNQATGLGTLDVANLARAMGVSL